MSFPSVDAANRFLYPPRTHRDRSEVSAQTSNFGSSIPSSRLPVAVLGATGIVGQRLVRMLAGHPSLRLAEVVASSRSTGRRYADVVPWGLTGDIPEAAARLPVRATRDRLRSRLVLSALPRAVATDLELDLARGGHVVCSNASAHRQRADVPLIVPEINAGDLARTRSQPWFGGGGALVTNPNCVVVGVALALAPIEGSFGIEEATVVTLQALTGAGLQGTAAVQMSANVVPWISGEEEKIGPELNKILGTRIRVAASTNRVPVLDGHMTHVFLKLRTPARPEEVERSLLDYRPCPSLPELPTLPERPLAVRSEPDRPQPRLDIGASRGMAVSVGRIRSAPPHDLALVTVVHNGIRGAAGACLANAELCVARGLLERGESRAGG